MNTQPSTTEELLRERSDFEKWYRATAQGIPENQIESNWLHRSEDGRYSNWATQGMWDTWQARASVLSTPQPQPIETAPDDGCLIWLKVHGAWELGRRQFTGPFKGSFFLIEQTGYTYDATHWIPLARPGTNPNVQECPNA